MSRIRLAALSLGLLGLNLVVACGSDKDGSFGEAGAAGESSTGGRATTGGRPNAMTGGRSAANDAGAGDPGDAGGSNEAGGVSSSSGGSGATGGGTVIGAGGAGADPPSLGACSNGLDDDEDGLADGMDPECTGPLDDDEDTFATGIPGDNRDPKWQDCFFDGNSGAGDDGCRYHTDCLYGDAPQTDASCRITDECRDFCQARTPNGCDCFGCCTVRDAEGVVADVYITASCSTDNLDDTNACPRCTKSDACENTCGRCELCPGKTEADIPEDCEPPELPPLEPPSDPGEPPPPDDTPPPVIDPPTYSCDEGGRVCGAELPCPSGSYCQLGCCLVSVF